MNVVDVNVLVALFLRHHAHHDRAAAWWAESRTERGAFAVPDLVWVGFLRLVTNRRVFAEPAPFDAAWAFITSTCASPRYRAIGSGPGVMRLVGQLAETTEVRADLVTDAYIAACALSVGAAVVTFDRDFRRFDGVRTVEPA